MGNRVSLGVGDRKVRRRSRRPGWELMERRQLLSTYLVTNTNDDTNPNSLRWAILQANAGTGSSSIGFDIPGSGVQTIDLGTPLPALENPVTIDGTTQPGYKGTPLVVLDGSALPSGSDGLVFSGGGSGLSGLAVVGFSGSGVVLNSSLGGNVIEGDYLGTLPSGTHAEGNGTGLSIIGSPSNTVGGTSAGSANVISGNTGDGILIQRTQTDSSENLIIGNLIGTAAGGTTGLGNSKSGIEIDAASNNQLGAPSSRANVVAGNLGAGITIDSGASGTNIQNNNVGVGSDGKTAVGNGGDGILLDDAPGTQIGGTDFDQANLIGANQGNGINVEGDTTGLLVLGNLIGTDLSLQLNLGNLSSGVRLASSSNTIGGLNAGAANFIYNNGTGAVGSGVLLFGTVDHNAILSNSIYKNANLGINLGDGPTPNHAPGTPGPNNYQNYPVLSQAVSDGKTTAITGTLSESPSTQYLIQFFASPTADPSGFGQGKILLGSDSIQTDANGNASFSLPLGMGSAPGSYISATATDPQGDTSEFALDVQTQGEINLILSGTATPNPVLAGSDVTYALSVSNQGSIDAHGVTLTDQLPPGVTVVSASASQGFVIYKPGRPTVTATLGTLPAGGTAQVTIVATSPGSAGTITDTATVTSQETDPNPSAESVSLTTSVELAADVAVAISASPDPVPVQGDLTYTITVSNLGPSSASNVSASLPLPVATTFVSASASAGTASFGAGQVTALLGDLAANGQATVTVVVQADAVGSLTATASASSDNIDPNTGNNSATVTTQVEASADLAVALSSSASAVADGIDFAYTVTVTNNGPSDDTNVAISDTLPQGVTFVSAASDQGLTPTESAGVVSLSLTTLKALASASITIVLDPTASPGATLTDSASAAGQVSDPNPANDAAALTLPVTGKSDLGISVTAQPALVYQGQDFTYTITATNQGPDDEPDATINSQLPGDLTFVSSAYSQGTAPVVNQNGLFTADLGPLPANHTAVVTLVAIPGSGSVGTLATTFSIQGQNVDPNPSNNSAQASVSVAPSTALSIAISPGAQPAFELVDWTYTLVVSNSGLSDATGVTAVAPLPANVVLVSATSSQGAPPTAANGSVSAAMGTIATGQTATVTMVVQPQTAGSMSLGASVSGNEFDLNPAGEQASATVTVAPSVNLSVNLSPAAQSVSTGHAFSCTALVTNTGPAAASNVVLTLPLLSGLVIDGATSTQGTVAPAPGQLVAQLGQINPASSAMVTMTLTATVPGTFTQTASLTQTENQLNPAGSTASATITALESPGLIQFGAASYSVPETAGSAILTVLRSDGSLGAVNVNYQTVAVNAVSGLDFVPTSGNLSFAAGQTTGTITVPVLADPWDNHDEYVNVVLSSPTGGALLGAQAQAGLRIVDVDPDFTPPQVSQLTWSGTARSITSLNLSFTAPLDPVCAVNPANYELLDLSASNQSMAVVAPAYSTATRSVTLVPRVPLTSGHLFEVVVRGNGAGAIEDVAGVMLDGAGTNSPGTSYVATFVQGTKLQYVDGSGNRVMLKLKGPGYLQQVRNQAGDGVVLNVVGEAPHRTTLSGSVHATRGSKGRTNLGVITGLGRFGDVRVLLSSPPFFVRQYPFIRRGIGVF
jgi:uncharacterized repeat protein (TIGR01451 family)